MGKLLCVPRDRVRSDEEVKRSIREIYVLSSANNATEFNNRDRSTQALRRIVKIIRRTNRSQLQLAGPREIIFSIVRIILNLQNTQHSSSVKCDCKHRRNCKMARACYRDLVETFIPEKSQDLIHSLVEIVHTDKLWQWEDYCWELVRILIEHEIEAGPIIHAFLNLVESEIRQIHESRSIVRIIYRILDNYSWPNNDETVKTVERLLELYHKSLKNDHSNGFGLYEILQKGLEVCVRHAIKNLNNDQLLVVVHRMCVWSVDGEISDVTILNYGSTLEYAANIHVSGLYENTMNPELFGVIMRMLSSSNRLVSLLGNRVLQYLIDRTNNRGQFNTPKIFFESTCYDLKINRYNKEDKYFLQKNRQLLHDSIVESMMNHCSVRTNLESTYCTICLIAAEVPCGFTAAAIVCLAMNLQDLTLERSEIYREASYHVHATVIAVMSVLCWIHDAKIFYSYVNTIVMERAQWAPHLNPPLKARYSFAVHHVLWNKPELFFVDWEARYGLWKCFRLRDGQRRNTNDDDASRRLRTSS